VDEALRLWQNKEAVIIDVRTPGEYRDGHIPGVVNIPLDELEKRMGEISREKKTVLICRTGNRSAQGTKLLRNKGFGHVSIVPAACPHGKVQSKNDSVGKFVGIA